MMQHGDREGQNGAGRGCSETRGGLGGVDQALEGAGLATATHSLLCFCFTILW